MQNKTIVNKCPILLKNSAVIVVRFNNIDVQLPYYDTKDTYAYVLFDNKTYCIVTEEEYMNYLTSQMSKNKKKHIKQFIPDDIQNVNLQERIDDPDIDEEC